MQQTLFEEQTNSTHKVCQEPRRVANPVQRLVSLLLFVYAVASPAVAFPNEASIHPVTFWTDCERTTTNIHQTELCVMPLSTEGRKCDNTSQKYHPWPLILSFVFFIPISLYFMIAAIFCGAFCDDGIPESAWNTPYIGFINNRLDARSRIFTGFVFFLISIGFLAQGVYLFGL